MLNLTDKKTGKEKLIDNDKSYRLMINSHIDLTTSEKEILNKGNSLVINPKSKFPVIATQRCGKILIHSLDIQNKDKMEKAINNNNKSLVQRIKNSSKALKLKA